MSCSRLTSISIPNSVTSIGGSVFHNCRNLSSLTIPENVTSIGSCAFYYCSGLSAINIPESVTCIEECTFWNCKSLTSITIPESVTRIRDQAFSYCSGLTSIIIPYHVSDIGVNAFSYCSSLTSITVLSDTPPSLGLDAFDNTNDAPIYVPGGSISIYKTTGNWTKYANRIRAIPSTDIPIPEAVDMGLSVKWASFNLGASKPEEYGDYFAWGETEPKNDFSWSSYKWCMGSYTSMTKYCPNSSYGYNGFTDTRTVLELEDDAASVILGGNWRLPTENEWMELWYNCTSSMDFVNGLIGRRFTSNSTGNSIFLPAAGYRLDTYLDYTGTYGCFWSSTLRESYPYGAWRMMYDSAGGGGNYHDRYYGFSIRPVCTD